MKPLSDREAHELSDLLDRSETGMSLEAAHGYLTAIVSAPTMIMPTVWQAKVFGDVKLETQAQFKRAMDLLVRFYNQIVVDLFENDVAPRLPGSDDGLAEWCSGYLEAAENDPIWQADDDADRQLLAFSVLAGEFDLVGQEDVDGTIITDASKHIAQYAAKLSDYVLALYRYWIKWRREHESPVVRATSTKVGRNEPCTCGSGKKFKKCCALTAN